MTAGVLYLVPNLLGAVPPANVLPARTIEIARRLTHFAVETPKAARAFLKSLQVAHAIANLEIVPLPSADAANGRDPSLAALLAGRDVGLLSDAGCPGVADPGAWLVRAAHEHGVRVVPLVGPSAILLALMASGMNGQAFCFHGYLPVKPAARAEKLRALEGQSRRERRTEMFIETPYRNVALLQAMTDTLDAKTRICVAADLTLATETIESSTTRQWRGENLERFDKRPAMFLVTA
ncbi:MAG TPA: SAM-dependent methyltransferase [Casimicrobiaceae bacterium]|nr:SAM-dependent methyltransferase [Casimicrobiaceae bacterium]